MNTAIASRKRENSEQDKSEAKSENYHPTPWSCTKTLLSILLTAASIVILCNLRRNGFFFIDDAQNESIGFYREMGRLWLSGNLPILTTKTFWGGNMLVDMVKSPFSPQVILLSITANLTTSLLLVANLSAFIDISLIIGGIYWIGRQLGVRQSHALLMGALVSTTPVYLYVFAASWWNLSHAFAWMTLAIAALLRFRRSFSPYHFLISVLCGSALFLSAGTQAQFFYILIFIPVLTADWNEKQSYRRLLIISSAGLCILLISIIPIMAEYLSDSSLLSRPDQLNNSGNFLGSNWGHIINTFNPLYGTYISWFGGYRYIPLSLAYSGVILLLPALFKEKSPTPKEYKPEVLIIISSLLISVVLSFTPQQLGPIRWSFRFLPTLSMSIIILCFFIWEHWQWASNINQRSRYFLITSLMLVAIQFFSADQRIITKRRIIELLALSLILITFKFAIREIRKDPKQLRPWLTCWAWTCSALALLLMLLQTPTLCGSFLSCPGVEVNPKLTLTAPQPGYTLPLAGRLPRETVYDLDSGLPLIIDQATISGYSPVGHVAFERLFPSPSAQGYFSPAKSLSSISELAAELNGTPVYQLFGIQRIYAWKAHITPELEKSLITAGLGKFSPLPNERVLIEPEHPYSPQGTLTYQSHPNTVFYNHNDGPRSEWFDVTSSGEPRRLVFGRIAWPGYQAKLNGESLATGSWRGVLVSLDLPAHSAGKLHLEYEPQSWRFTRYGLMLGIILTIATAALLRRCRYD